MRITLPDGREMNVRVEHNRNARYTRTSVEMPIYKDAPHRVRYEGLAKCSKNDNFNRKIGRKIAAERMIAEMRGMETKETRRYAFDAVWTPEKFKKKGIENVEG